MANQFNLANKSVMVTGGAGFIGSHLVERIIREQPSNIIVVDNFFLGKESNLDEARSSYPKLKVFNRDAADYEAMKSLVGQEGVQVVFNVAVIPLPTSLEKPRWTYDVNNAITTCFCELAREGAYNTLIHCSSSEAYGTCRYAPMDENHPLVPTTPYGASKAAGDLLVISYVKTFNIDAAVIRPFNNYGPRQNDGSYAGVVPITIRRIMAGEAPVIYGDGEQTRDYIYVTDTAEAAVRIYRQESTRGKIINIGSGGEISINRLVRLIAEHLDYRGDIVYAPERPGDVRRLYAGIDLARELIDFTPSADFSEGLKRTIDWYQGRNQG